MHSIVTTHIIGAQESVYGDSSAGKLEKSRIVEIVLIPHQQRLDSDSQARFPVGIDRLPAFAFEQRIIGGIVSVPDSTAAGTPFARMPTIHDVQTDIIVKASLFENALEFEERNTHHFTIESFPFRFEAGQLLDGDVGIKKLGKTNNLADDLTEIRVDKILFLVPQSRQLLDRIDGLKFRTPAHQFLSSYPNVLSEVCLVKNLATGRNDADGEVFRVNINSQHVFSFWDTLFFGQERGNLQVRSQAESLANPTIINQAFESLVIPVRSDRDCGSFSRVNSEFDEKTALSAEDLAIARNVELDRDRFYGSAFRFDNGSFNITNYLTVKKGGFFGS